jgi:predicted ATPase
MNVEAFRDCVQEYLRTGGYTQEELARSIGLHAKVLSRKLHSSAHSRLTLREVRAIVTKLADWHVLTSREEVREVLATAEIDPGILQQSEWQTPLLNDLPQARPASQRTLPDPPHNLPATLTRLIGRGWAVERLRHLLVSKETRLVTLVGAGGSGKTLLALHVAKKVLAAFAQGVWFISLASVSDPDLVPLSIIHVLNIKSPPDLKPLQSLTTYLHDKELLLVLDNFEHLGEARAVVDAILAAAPRITVLITSRVVQRLYGEREFRVPPLDIPDPGVPLQAGQLTQYGAVQLFLERAQAVAPDFALTDENAATVAQICARVDGLPLALELAAARIKILSPESLLERLAQASLPILTRGAKNLPGRQQTLGNTIKWSYDLLSPEEQTWFCRLAIFSGGCALETVQAMMQELCAGEKCATPDPLDLLEQLVDSSLLTRLPDEQKSARFTMLSTLREYALEQLAGQDEYEQVRDWHACYFLRKAEKAVLDLRGPQQLRCLALLRANNENFRAALEWSLQKARDGLSIRTFPASSQTASGAGTGARRTALEFCLRLASALRPCWEWQGNLIEARHWLNAVLQVPLENDAEPDVLAARAYALSEAARVIFLQNEKARALALIEESLALWQRLGDRRGLAMALLHRGWVAHGMDEYEAAKAFYQQGVDLISPDEDTWLYVQLLIQLADAAGFTSDYELADACYERSRQLSAQIGDKSAIADAWKDQGGILLLQSNWNEALTCLLKSIQICQEIEHKQYLATGLGLVSFAVGMREEPDPQTASLDSARMRGAADALMEKIGLTPWTRTSPFIQAVRQLIRSRVNEQDWEAAWQAGYALTLDEAIELAYRLGKAETPPKTEGDVSA